MPNIKEYDAGNLTLNPTDKGTDAAAAAGRRIGGFYNQVAQGMDQVAQSETDTGNRIGSAVSTAGAEAVKYEDHREVSQGAATFAQLTADLTAKRNDWIKNADPNDPSVVSKFNEQVLQPALDNFQSAFSTENAQQWAEGHADALRTHMFQQNSADLSTMAAEAVSVNIKKSENAWTNTARSDPSSTNFLLEQAEHSVGAIISSSPALSATDAAKVRAEGLQKTKEAIVKAGALGTIEKAADPEKAATDFAARYPNFINGAELGQFVKAAQAQTKVNNYYDKQTVLAEKQAADLKVHGDATKTMTDNMSIDPQTGEVRLKPNFFHDALDIARNNPNAPSAAATARTMIDFGQSQQNKELKPVDDAATKTDLTDRMFSPDKPTTTLDLMKARADGKISDHTFQVMHGLVQELEQAPLKGPVWQDTIGAVKGQLILSGVGLPGKDITGETNYAKWAQTFIPQYLAASRAGTLPPNALDVKDPKSLISQSMAPFQRTIQQRTKDYMSSLQGIPGAAGPAPIVSGHEVPTPLRGIAALQYNPSKDLWRDQTTGMTYDKNGNPVKP